MDNFLELQLEFIRWVHQARSPLMDGFFKSLAFFDSIYYTFVVVGVIWFGYYWKAGLRILAILMMNTWVNFYLKILFNEPRPFDLDPSLAVMRVSGGGFPSGAAQMTVLLSCIMISTWKSKWRWAIAGLYFFFVSFSRVYLGVHLISDLVGGWVIGGALFLVYKYLFPIFEKGPLLLLSQIVPLGLYIILPISKMTWVYAMTMSLGWGLYLSKRYNVFLPKNCDIKKFFIRRGIGVALIFAFYGATHYFLSPPMEMGLFGFLLTFGVNFLSKRVGCRRG